jgi:hypothetical protein
MLGGAGGFFDLGSEAAAQAGWPVSRIKADIARV